MFEPENRENLLDILRPPSGYSLSAAVGTTYGMDFLALTSAMLTLAGCDAEEEAPARVADSLKALIRLSDRVRVFVNSAQIGLPKGQEDSRLLAMYDRVVRYVWLENGSFHPKVWVMKYEARQTPEMVGKPVIVRLICSSRNLTRSHYWELFTCLEGVEGRAGNDEIGPSVAAFLRKVAASGKDASAEPVLDVLESLPKVEFLPRTRARQTNKSCQFFWGWPEAKPLAQQLPRNGRRALILSPFVQEEFLRKVVASHKQVILVSTQTDLDKIGDRELLAQFGQNLYVLVPQEVEDGTSGLDSLHAKLYIWEEDGGTRLHLGSANASGRAWQGGNCEAMVAFSPGVSIDQFRAQFMVDREGNLQPWIERYQPSPYAETEEERIERRMEDIRKRLAGMTISATYEKNAKVVRLSAFGISLQADVSRWSDEFGFSVCLLSQSRADQGGRDLAALLAGGVSFQPVEVVDLTEFVVIEVSHRRLDAAKRFVLKAQSDFVSLLKQRDAEVLRWYLKEKGGFRQLLWSILTDEPLQESTPAEGGDKSPGKGESFLERAFGRGAALEDVLQACTEDPARIEEISRLLECFKDTDFVDDSFRDFWQAFRDAWKKANEVTAHG